jgi:diguanylate cyclase (GGDEF)-like protein
MKLSIKIYLLLMLALIIGLLFGHSIKLTNQTLRTNAHVLSNINQLSELQHRLDKQTLKSAYLIYHNYDEMDLITRQMEQIISELQQSAFYSNKKYAETRKLLSSYVRSFETKKRNIRRFQTLNSVIKNSASHIPTLGNRFFQSTVGVTKYGYYSELLNIISDIFLSKHSLDPDFLFDVSDSLELLDGMAVNNTGISAFNKVFRAHVDVFIDNFPQYTKHLSNILESDSGDILGQINTTFSKTSQAGAVKIENLTLILSVLFALAFLYIAWMLLSAHRTNLQLTQLQSQLYKEAYFDRLTGLGSRLAYNRETNKLKSPIVVLFDIDGFKQINDFYGNHIGDQILKYTGQKIQSVASHFSSNTQCYRLSADEYAVTMTVASVEKASQFAAHVIRSLGKKSFRYKQFNISVDLSAGISTEEPLLEKADLALKYTKGKRLKYMNYSPDLMLEQEVEDNLTIADTLKTAIDYGRVMPWFQPIVYNKTGEVSHYECLMRVHTADGKVLNPNEFLPVAKTSQLYVNLTRIMMEKCFELFANKDTGFSINLSAEDALDPTITQQLFRLLDANPGIASRFMLELLESEAIEDYDKVRQFIDKLRARGCQVAIDDFGAGYSSLEHVLKLNPDIIKLDGSLIRDLDTDSTANTFVRALIVTLKQIGIDKVIAEYVHSASIQDIVQGMDIACSQGYYIGKPRDAVNN